MASTTDLANLITRLEAAVNKLESKSSGGSGDAEEVSRFIEDYDAYVSDCVEPYLSASAVIGGAVEEQSKIFKAVCNELRKFLLVVSKFSAPKDIVVFGKLAGPMGETIGKMDACKRTAKLDQKNHVNAACEGVSVFGWITYPKAPMKHVEETKESVKFYSNKVLTETKNSDKAAEHKAWVNAYLGVFDGLHSYIKEHHRTGPSWNAKGAVATESSGAAAASGVPPPPPPPPVVAAAAPPAASKAPAASAVSALLSDISRGADVTKGLKKVTNDMKTHKNPDLRKHSAVPFKPKTSEYKPMGGKKAVAPKKPPKMELQGKKWVVEYQSGRQDLLIADGQMKHTVYAYRCDNCTITVKGKINSIVLDSCKKTGVVFHSVVSGIEVINCQSVQVQAQGQMPTISIDKTDGCIVYLSKDCLDCRVVSAKSSEMNVCTPKDDGDFNEYPIVEQFCTYWDAAKKTFLTVPSESLG